jgi:hypothetical protein
VNKTQKIQAWLCEGNNKSYGALHLMGCSAYTYNVTLAHVDRVNRTAVVNNRSYSTTSSGHRNRLLEALEAEGYGVTLTDGPPQIPEGFEETHG